MPRKPTGKPRGRPLGSGELGEQTRLTVRIPTKLYDRLVEHAEGRTFTRGAPKLAGCVREALEHYLVPINGRQQTYLVTKRTIIGRQKRAQKLSVRIQDRQQMSHTLRIACQRVWGIKDGRQKVYQLPS
jgi:hypothetical protein